jgi:hypothetical protein
VREREGEREREIEKKRKREKEEKREKERKEERKKKKEEKEILTLLSFPMNLSIRFMQVSPGPVQIPSTSP